MDERPGLLLTIDLEDWHQLVHRRIGRADWDRPHPAFEHHVDSVLGLLDELGARATFFLLGMTVANYPGLVRRIVAAGHEPACHGYAHARLQDLTPVAFRDDLLRSMAAIGEAAGRAPLAYRAPAFSITRTTAWAYEALAELGFRYDSSQYDSPRVGDRLGSIPAAPYRLELASGTELWELPVAVWRSLPVGGGSYWRLLPAPVLLRALEGLRRQGAYPVLYFHPYEFAQEPLRAVLPSSPTARQRLTATTKSLWRNAGRPLVGRRLREIARHYRLQSFEQAYDDIDRRYGTRTRALSPQGVLV